MNASGVNTSKDLLPTINILKRNNVTVSGSGPHTILFAHGFGCDQNTWQLVAKSFEDEYRVILFDYVGAGQSDLSQYDSKKYSTLQGYAQDILDICACMQIEKAVLVGHSVSCMIAVLAALQQPSYFEKLVFVSPSPYFFRDGEYIGGLEKRDVDDLFDMMDSNYLGWSSFMAPAIMGNADRPELGEGLTKSFCATQPAIAREFARVTFYSDNRAYLPRLQVESLTLQCAQDMLAPEAIGQYMKDQIPGNTLIQLTATGHCPHLSAPEEITLSIKNFLQTAW